MTNNKIRVGIVGLQPGRSWASLAHIPALQHLSDDFEIVGVANSSLKSSRAAATACGIPIAFDGVSQMAASPETGEYISMDAADQIVVTGLMNSGAPFSIHFQGGEPRGTEGFVWDIHGSEGDLRVTGENGMTQIMPLTLTGARGEEKRLRPMPIPDDRTEPAELVSGNVARIYKRLAADLRNGTRTAPDFDDAVRLHMLLDTIIRASISGERLPAAVSNRELP